MKYKLGPALDIGRRCGGLGPIDIGGLKKITEGDIYSNTWFKGGLYSNKNKEGPNIYYNSTYHMFHLFFFLQPSSVLFSHP